MRKHIFLFLLFFVPMLAFGQVEEEPLEEEIEIEILEDTVIKPEMEIYEVEEIETEEIAEVQQKRWTL
ncbi:MAG: hypothetical protein ACJAUH_003012, partial [Saprospiraceae bacterium]